MLVNSVTVKHHASKGDTSNWSLQWKDIPCIE